MACLDLKLTIDGVDRTSLLVHETLTISQTNDGLNSTCTFDLLDQAVIREGIWTVEETEVEDGDVITGYLTFFPQTKVIVCITNAAATLIYFAGTLARISATHMGQLEVMPGFVEPETQVLRCECQDFNQILEEMVIDDFREYGGIQDEDLIDAVFDEFVFPFGNPIDYATHVTAVPYVFDIITFDSITVRQFMDTICAQSGAVWYVDYEARLHYAADEAALVPAWHLSDRPDNANSFEYFDDITKEKDATNLVNRVFVVCGTDLLPVSLWFIDQVSIDTYGSHRAIVRDTSLFDIDDIEAKGNSILEKFKDPIVTYVLKTYKGTPGGGATNVIRAGQHIRVVCAFYDLDETFLINSLVITFPVDGTPVYEITCGGLDSSASASARRLDLDRISVPNITPSSLPIASRGWGHDMTFSATDDDTVAWEGPGAGDGTITTADGVTFTITPANTGDMAAVTYVYLDTALSVTTLQTSVNPVDSIGLGKILIAVCVNDTAAVPTNAMYQVFGGGAGTTVFLHADNIAANCITINEIYGNSLEVIAANIGVLTIEAAGEIRAYTNDWDVDADGFRITHDEIAGQWDGTDQVVLSAADGKLRAGAGAVILDVGGITVSGGRFSCVTDVGGQPRIHIDSTEIAGYDGADVLQFQLKAVDGKAYAGAGAVVLDAAGIYMVGAGAAGTTRQLRFFDNSAGVNILGNLYSDWGGGAGKVYTWLTSWRQAGDPWPVDVRTGLAAIDSIAGTDVRWYVTSAGAIYSLSCTDFYIFDGARHTIRLTGGDAVFILSDAAGAKKLKVQDAATVDVCTIDSNGSIVCLGDVRSSASFKVGSGLVVGSSVIIPAAGQIHFNSTTFALRRNVTHLEWYDGGAWVQLDNGP